MELLREVFDDVFELKLLKAARKRTETVNIDCIETFYSRDPEELLSEETVTIAPDPNLSPSIPNQAAAQFWIHQY